MVVVECIYDNSFGIVITAVLISLTTNVSTTNLKLKYNVPVLRFGGSYSVQGFSAH